MSIESKLNSIRNSIGSAEIVGACKGQTAQSINKLFSLGINKFGQNRVQDFLSVYDECDKGIEWHFIGQLQTNKVKYIIDKVSLIQSLDRKSLCEEINSRASKINKICDCLIEVNVSGQQNRGGVGLNDLFEFCKLTEGFDNIRIRGLMCVMPLKESSNLYLQMRSVYDILKGENRRNFKIDYLSMGMSDDYLEAVKAGANMVRLGRLLFN